MRQYVIRYRCQSYGHPAFIVSDADGRAYLFSGGALQGWLAGEQAATRLLHLLDGHTSWVAVPEVAPYMLEDLRGLASGDDWGPCLLKTDADGA